MLSIKHTHGITENYSTLGEALSELRLIYGPETVVYGPDGGRIDEGSDVAEVLARGRALVWQDEESSVDDTGARAVASLTYSA